MRVTRIYLPVPLSPGDVLALPAGQAQHLTRVLRLEAGAELTVFNGMGGEYSARIEEVRRGAVTVRIGAHDLVEKESPLHTTLLQGIARGEKMDLILQKATELGVSRVVPMSCVRSTVRLQGDAMAKKQVHWQAVVASACEQCGRNRVPVVAEPVALAGAAQAVQGGLRLLLTPDEESAPIGEVLAAHLGNGGERAVAVMIGPEGGFDAAEVRAAKLAGFASCRVGPRVLRTETAGLAALAILQGVGGDLG